ncbi:iron reductase [Lentinula raphanica]|uniref:Iron reductase n=1 Tax=Lentinula raphanica TaxID=153919 RepID=A0AA38PF70_9AGAR|nr:iron reductase [Lentinula raphanica]KAJ3841822.1 iron reductase [Lentinula raphanica]
MRDEAEFSMLNYIRILTICITHSDIDHQPNFLALAQVPVVFLFSTKNSIVSLLLGPGHGYEKVDYIHRWSGRCLFLGTVVHGSLWIPNHLQYNVQIIGAQKDTRSLAALGVLCGIVLTSLRPVRKWSRDSFWVVHVLGFVAFFITICYHTIYATPWIFPPLAFYTADMLMRMLRVRIKDATLTAVDSNMTWVLQDCDTNWIAGQHVRLRVFFSGRVFESHPLTIMNAPAAYECHLSRIAEKSSRALNNYADKAISNNDQSSLSDQPALPPEAPVQVMLDGPYGGCSLDLGQYQTVLLIADGSGATFTICVLDDIIGCCARLGRPNNERTRRIEFVWCLRSYTGINWFTSLILPIANVVADSPELDLPISAYVTCLCNPEAVPPIPNSDVLMLAQRPDTLKILENAVVLAGGSDNEDVKYQGSTPEPSEASAKLQWVGLGGAGVAVCTSGPGTLTREASNAVAKSSLLRESELGGVGLHTEVFSVQ